MRVLILGLLIAIFIPMTSLAQSAESITSFNSKIDIDTSNTAFIQEEITYDFGANSRRGIYRTIPTKTDVEGTNQEFIIGVSWGQVLQDGQPAETLITTADDYSELRIGNPNIYLTGEHTYTINYVISPIAQRDQDGDFISLNITGNNWDVPISNVKAAINLPSNVDVIDSQCFTGSAGSTAEDCSVATNTSQVTTASVSKLGAYEGLTINQLVTEDSFSAYLAPTDKPPFDWSPFIPLLIGLVGLLMGGLLRFIYWMQHRWRKKSETTYPRYEAPSDLTPGEIGLLYDNKSGMQEITAIIINLAIKGYLRIEQTQKKSWLKSAKYTFHKKESKKSLSKNEKLIFDLLFDSGEKSKKLSDIDRASASKDVETVKKNLKKNLEKAGYVYTSGKAPKHKFKNKVFKVLLLLLVGWTLGWIVYKFFNDGAFATLFIASGISLVMLGIGCALAVRTELSPTGYKKWGEIEGLKFYLEVAERDRLKFHNAPEKSPEHFSAMLPFAIALGVEKQWAKQFESLNIEQNIDWYTGYYGLSAMNLASDLGGDFSSSLSSGFSAPSSSSGGFSGGGFSGGGVGGGGGGSW